MMDQNRSEEVMGDKPLVTFALFAYNQEQFIREAIEGAFSQTYSPLEIILSDDCSSDNTFAIMKEMAAAYTGEHMVRVRSCAKNRGLAEHINEVMREVRSEFIVVAAGDDISEMSRVARLVKDRTKYRDNIVCIYSDIAIINAEGDIIRPRGNHCDYSSVNFGGFIKKPYALMCSYAFDASVYRKLGELLPNLCNEDFIFPFRTLLLGGVVAYIDEPLVRYRIGHGHQSGEKCLLPAQKLVNEYRRSETMHCQLLGDIGRSALDENYSPILKQRLLSIRTSIQVLECNCPRNILFYLHMMARDQRGFYRLNKGLFKIYFPRLISYYRIFRSIGWFSSGGNMP
ncbi:MAG: glycosyltransferase [Acidithiobacillus sp.]